MLNPSGIDDLLVRLSGALEAAEREPFRQAAYLRRTGHRPYLTAEQQAAWDALQIKIRREPPRLKGSPHGDH